MRSAAFFRKSPDRRVTPVRSVSRPGLPASVCCLLFLPVLSTLLGTLAAAQTPLAVPSNFPASRSTTGGLPVYPATQPAGQVGTPSSNQPARHRAEVHLQDGLLTVTAVDASLNGILREIARQTGMKISGGVHEDRVFGSYGPADPSAVLSTLLEGTGSNVLLVSTAADQPTQLILSPRLGGASPPSQFASQRASNDDDPESFAPFAQQPAFGAPVPAQSLTGRPTPPPGQNLTPALPSPTSNNSDSQAIVFPSVNATTTPATATTSSDTTQEAPGGVKTPQQIFEQLQKLRQQQEQTQGVPVQQ